MNNSYGSEENQFHPEGSLVKLKDLLKKCKVGMNIIKTYNKQKSC